MKHTYGTIEISPMIYPTIPPFKLRSELEMEKIINKSRVLTRLNQIKILKLDSEYPIEPFNICNYTNPERRSTLFKIIWLYLRNLLLSLRP